VEVYEDAVLVLGRDRLRGQDEDIDAADRRLFELSPFEIQCAASRA
jgi:hypothetical protein